MIQATVSAATHVGHVRKRNEDYFAATGIPRQGSDGEVITAHVSGATCLAIVADGLGGHPAGDVASRLVVEAIIDEGPETPTSLVEALLSANKALYAAMTVEDGTLGMGATVAAVLINETGLAVANVGDSKVFEFTEGSLCQLSTDDTPEHAAQLPGLPTSTVTQSLGGGREPIDVHPHLTIVQGGPGQRVLVCSDGLTDYVPATEICKVLGQGFGPDTVEELISLALEAGGRDNVTVLMIEADHLLP